MKSIIKNVIITVIVVLPYADIFAQGVANNQSKALIQIPAETIVDKIRGGLLGQMIGNLNGLPTKYNTLNNRGM